MELTFAEGRVLGCLVEKQLLTPQAYPLTDNALVAACNQTTSRDPIVQYDVPTVRIAVRSLRESGLLKTRHGERSDKHEHRLGAALGLPPAEVALLAVLLLRGPQTPGELRGRTERMHAFDSVEEVERVLDGLAERPEPLVTRLERQPGRKEVRYVDALVLRDAPPGLPPAPPRTDGAEPPAAPVTSGTFATLAALASEVADLRAEVAELRAALSELRDDVGL
ncbi:MAG TPA: DUF480 domain-containing protein [Frankiaceae bacterium]|nr:DUF480 domain-containing protein [Frankiaceae bacterium]